MSDVHPDSSANTGELKRLGPYRIIRTLARGGMSEVYVGHVDGQTPDPELLVLKVLRLPKDVPSDSPRVREMMARLIEEGRLGLRLNHPAIARSMGVQRDQEQDLYFLVQEFVEGMTLGDLMDYYLENDQRIPYGVVLRLMIPVLQALHYGYHDAMREDGRHLRVVHRDIKPDNIMLSYAGQTKLVDFGVARSTSLTRYVTVGDVVVGTRHYMAPEQVFTPDQVGHRADLFSLGLILFELCTLKPVFPRTRAVSEFAQALAKFSFDHHAPQIDAKRYPGIREVLARVLQSEPKDRYAAAGDFARDLMVLEQQAPQQPTLAEFAIQLKEEIAEAEGASTMMGGESVVIAPVQPERVSQVLVPPPRVTSPPVVPPPSGPRVEPWDAPVRKSLPPNSVMPPQAPAPLPAGQPWPSVGRTQYMPVDVSQIDVSRFDAPKQPSPRPASNVEGPRVESLMHGASTHTPSTHTPSTPIPSTHIVSAPPPIPPSSKGFSGGSSSRPATQPPIPPSAGYPELMRPPTIPPDAGMVPPARPKGVSAPPAPAPAPARPVAESAKPTATPPAAAKSSPVLAIVVAVVALLAAVGVFIALR